MKQFRFPELRLIAALFGALAVFGGVIATIVLALYTYSVEREYLSKIPLVIQIFSCFIVIFTGILMKLMLVERDQALKAYDSFLSLIKPLLPANQSSGNRGILPEKLTEIRKRVHTSSGFAQEWWKLLEESFESYLGPDGQQGWFLLRPIREILDEDTLVWSIYHSSFHQAVPGILTALGLLGTFIAILQGLSGVSYNPHDTVHPVSGIDSLVNGLSGKFLSSILALIVSIAYTFVEKKLCERTLLLAYGGLLARCQGAIPYLPESRILLDIQTTLLKSLSSERASAGEIAISGNR